MLKTTLFSPNALAAWERIVLALWLIGKDKPISWLTSWMAPDYHPANLYSLMVRLVKSGLVTRSTHPGHYRLGAAGWSAVASNWPILSLIRPGAKEISLPSWYGKFFCLALDAHQLSPASRRQLTHHLQLLHFGRLTRGVYISAHPEAVEILTRFLISTRLNAHCRLSETTPLDMTAPQMAELVWQSAERNQLWRSILDRWAGLRPNQDIKAPRDRDQKPQGYPSSNDPVLRLHDDFLKLLLADPILPAPLQSPKSWLLPALHSLLSPI